MNYFVKDMTNFYKGSIPTPDSRPRNPPPEFRGRESGAGIDLGESQLPIPAPGLAPDSRPRFPPPEFRGRDSGGGIPGVEKRRGQGAPGMPGAGILLPPPEFRGRALNYSL